MRIRTSLFLAFLILVGLGFYKLTDWIIKDVRPRYLESMEESMVDMATILSSIAVDQAIDGEIQVDGLRSAFDDASKRIFSAKIYDLTKTHLCTRVYVTDEKGIVIFDSEGGKDEGKDYSSWNDVIRTLRGEYGARTTRADPKDQRTSVLYVASPVKVDDKIVGVLTVCRPTDNVSLFIEMTKQKITFGGALAALTVVLLGMVISSWITRPIHKLIRYANAIRDGERASPPNLGWSEMSTLGTAFEEMRDALEGKQYVENYVQTLTHQMKSPLSAIRGAAELLEEDMPPEERARFLKNIRTEMERTQNLVDRLLQLSALESRKGLGNVEEVDLKDVAEEVAESMKPLLDSKHISLASEIKEPVGIRGERFLIQQAFVNLLQNAIDFTPNGGAVSISLKKESSQAEFAVANNGPDVPDYALDKVFDRFYSLPRPDTGKKSSGLGLTFVREVAILHGGKITIENQPGGGAKATMQIPLSSQSI